MKVLFIGNSHTYFNDMPYQFAELMHAAGQETEVTMLTRGGQKVEAHIKNEQTRFNILYGKYDWVILQENTTEFPDGETHAKNAAVIKEWCEKAGAKLGLYMNFESPFDTPKLEYLRGGILYAAEKLALPVARVGEAFAKAKETLPHIDLHFTDRHHANAVGSYLIAMVIAHDLFGVDVTGLPNVIGYKGETVVSVPEANAKALQALVQEL